MKFGLKVGKVLNWSITAFVALPLCSVAAALACVHYAGTWVFGSLFGMDQEIQEVLDRDAATIRTPAEVITSLRK